MTLAIRIDSTPVVVTLPERLDGANASEAEADLAPVLAAARTTVIDASRCAYISSAGLRLLLILAKRLTPAGGKVLIAGMSPDLMEIMRITGFDHLFVFHPTLEDAIAAGG
ncbi:MAG: STAS domain-containing protein [Rhodospirillaceae bacterium]